MDRSTVDKVGLILTILLAVLPQRWWVQSVLIVLGAAFACDLILHLPWIRRLPEAAPLKIYFSLCVFYLVLLMAWNPIRQEYLKESQSDIDKSLARTKPEERAESTKPTEEKLPKETKRSPQIPSSKEPKPEIAKLSIDLALRVVHYVDRYKEGAINIRHNEYGFAAIVRVRNKGEKTEQLKALEIKGDIDADGSDYSAAFGEGKTFEEIDIDYGKRKPYYRVSFVSYPITVNKIDPGSEEFIRFMVLDPINLSTQAIVRGDDAKKYIGFRGDNPAVPSLLTTVPNIRSFVNFTRSEHKVPGNAQLFGPRLRDEIKSGRLQFSLRFESGYQLIDSQKIENPALISLDNWSKQTPQDIFFKNNIWDRAMPVTKDPLVESGR
jgi:hypothetical protein